MKRILVALLLLIWGVVSGPAQAFAEDGSVEPRILIMRQCGDISFSKGGCVYAEDDGSFRGVVEFRIPLTPAQRKARAEAAQARKQRELDMEQRIAMLESRLSAPWTASSATMPYSPMPPLAAPVASASTPPEPVAKGDLESSAARVASTESSASSAASPLPDTTAQRIAELEAQVNQLATERGTLQQLAGAHTVSIPLWLKAVLVAMLVLTVINTLAMIQLWRIAASAQETLRAIDIVAPVKDAATWVAKRSRQIMAWRPKRWKHRSNERVGLNLSGDAKSADRPEGSEHPEIIVQEDEIGNVPGPGRRSVELS